MQSYIKKRVRRLAYLEQRIETLRGCQDKEKLEERIGTQLCQQNVAFRCCKDAVPSKPQYLQFKFKNIKN
eukprot:1314740-Amphidinium_carterae.1